MKQSGNVVISIDFVQKLNVEEIAKLMSHDIAAVLKNEIGPAGGNPEYVLIGQPGVIAAYLVGSGYCETQADITEMFPELGSNF